MRRGAVGEVGDGTRQRLATAAVERFAVDQQLASRLAYQPGCCTQEGGLARAIRTGKTDELAGGHRQRHAAQHHFAVQLDRQVLRDQQAHSTPRRVR